jgi:tetratricopeptide (TPR) repeat protein
MPVGGRLAMLRNIVATAVLLCLALPAYGASRRGSKKDIDNYHITWLYSLDEGKIVAAKYLRPIVLHFCPDGTRVAFNEDASTFDTRQIKALAPSVVFVRIQPDVEPGLEKKYGVKEIPSLILIDEKGKRLNKNIEGHCAWEDLEKAIKAAHRKKKPLKKKSVQKLDRAWALYERAIKKKEYRKAVKALSTVKTVSRETWFHEQADKALEAIDKTAQERYAAAEELSKTDSEKAVKQLSGIEKNFVGRPAAKKAKELRQKLLKEKKIKAGEKEPKVTARSLFKEALDLRDAGETEKAKAKLRELIKKFPKDPFAGEARRILEELEKG